MIFDCFRVVLSISCDTSSNSYSSKNTVNIDENMIRSIKIGGNFIAYLTIKGQVRPFVVMGVVLGGFVIFMYI